MSTTLSIRHKPTHPPKRLSKSRPMAALENPAPQTPAQKKPAPEDPAPENLTCAEPSPANSHRQASNRQITELIGTIAHTHLSPECFSQALSSHLTSIAPITPQLTDPVTEATIATQYGQTCISLWQLAQCQYQLGSPSPSLPHPLPEQLSKVSFSQQQFTQQLTKLCHLWAIGKWQQPTHTFFATPPTAFAALQAKWQSPTIQGALREATAHLRQNPQEGWITNHADCWAYLLGNVMYQLLQWNYQLTPSSLGELLQGDEGKPDDVKPDAR